MNPYDMMNDVADYFDQKPPDDDGPDDATIEHAWVCSTVFEEPHDPNKAFHAGFRAGVVWEHNRSLENA